MNTAKSENEGDLPETIPDSVPSDGIFFVAKKLIHPDPDQPRVDADDELRASIAEHGIIQAITVRPHPTILDEWMIIDGERRYRGADEKSEIPCRIRFDLEEPVDRLVIQLAANTGKPLTPLEEAKAFKRILDSDPSLTQVTLANKLKVPRSTIGDRLRLAALPAIWIEPIEAGVLQVSHAAIVHPFAHLPEASHKAILGRVKKHWRWADAVRDGRPIEINSFKEAVKQAFSEANILYPLQKSPQSWHAQPEFAVADHDKECECGRVRLDLQGSGARDYCANPSWWKPKQNLADEKKVEKTATRDRVSSHSRLEPKIHLPEGAGKTFKYAGYGEPNPKHAIRLTNDVGRWNISGHAVTPFDPAALDLEPSDLCIVLNGGDYRSVGTRAVEKVRKAQEAFTLRLLPKRDEVVANKRKSLESEFAVRRIDGDEKTLRSTFAACLGFNREEEVVEAALLAGAVVPTDLLSGLLTNNGTASSRAVREWAATLSLSLVKDTLRYFAILFVGEEDSNATVLDSSSEKSLFEELNAVKQELVAELQRQDVPWVSPPKDKKGRILARCDWCSDAVVEAQLRPSRVSVDDRLCERCQQNDAEEFEADSEDGNAATAEMAELSDVDVEKELVEA